MIMQTPLESPRLSFDRAVSLTYHRPVLFIHGQSLKYQFLVVYVHFSQCGHSMLQLCRGTSPYRHVYSLDTSNRVDSFFSR